MQPRYIYLTYGLNDIKIGHWASLDSHVADYMDFVGQIRQRVPGAVIVISSVLPFYDPTVPDSSAPAGSTPKPSSSTLTDADRRRLTQIPQWNELMKAACAENGVIFVDNSAIGKELKDLYESDGIHVMKPFYPHWGKNPAIAALEEGGVAGENSAA
jgi:lysophospholipase L1-like esterase